MGRLDVGLVRALYRHALAFGRHFAFGAEAAPGCSRFQPAVGRAPLYVRVQENLLSTAAESPVPGLDSGDSRTALCLCVDCAAVGVAGGALGRPVRTSGPEPTAGRSHFSQADRKSCEGGTGGEDR